MAFQATFYTFSKRDNSTARPTGTGHPYNCTAKAPLTITAPRLQLQLAGGAAANPSAWNYCYIAAFSRYYWVSDWTNEGPLWTAALSVDALASWRTEIGNLSLYVYRSSSAYNLRIADTLYPTIASRRYLNINLPKPWTIGGASASGAPANTGIIVLGILSGTGVSYYGFTPANLLSFMDYLFSATYYDTVLGEFGAIEYPEAKVAVNPMQYITSAKYIPMGVSTAAFEGFQPWTLHASTITGVNVGTVSLNNQQAYAFFAIEGTPIQYHTTESYYDIEVTADMLHPQADERGEWLNMPPHTSIELFYPPFGIIPLDAGAISQAEIIRIRLTVDVWTASAVVDVILDPGTAKEQIISRLTGAVGADIPLANILVTGHSTTALGSNILSGVSSLGSLFMGNTGGASETLSAIHASVGTVVEGRVPHLSTVGGQGTTAQLDGVPRLMISHWLQSPDDLEGRGRPLCDKRQLSIIPGYIMADADEVSIPCTASELSAIKAAIRGGFYYA